MSELVKFNYLNNKEYNKTVDKIDCFKSLNRDDKVYGVIGHGKKQIGTITLNDKEYKVYNKKSYKNFWHRTVGYVQVADHAYLRLVKLNPIAFLLLGVIGALIIAGGILGFTLIGTASADDDITLVPDDNAEYVGQIGYSLGGYIVNENGEAITGAKVTLYNGNQALADMNSNDTGSFMYRNVTPGYYMVVVEYNGKVHTKLVAINEADDTVKFVINTDEGSSEVAINDRKSDIAVGNVDDAAKVLTKDVKVTLKSIDELSAEAYAAMPNAFKDGSAELNYEVYEAKAYINNAQVEDIGEVVEIVIPFVTSDKTIFEVYRYAANVGEVLTEATTRADGTYYSDSKYVHIFSSKFNQFALVYGENNGKVVQDTTVGFEEYVYVDLASGTANFYFYHNGSGASAVLDLIAYDTNGNEVVLMTTNNIGDGYKIETSAIDTSRLIAGNYSGLLRARYVNSNGSLMNTNIDMPVTIIVQ